jgi:hypothetical protein
MQHDRLSLNGKSFPGTRPTPWESAEVLEVNYLNEGVWPIEHLAPRWGGSSPRRVPLEHPLPATRSTTPRAIHVLYKAVEPGVWRGTATFPESPRPRAHAACSEMVTALIVK